MLFIFNSLFIQDAISGPDATATPAPSRAVARSDAPPSHVQLTYKFTIKDFLLYKISESCHLYHTSREHKILLFTNYFG